MSTENNPSQAAAPREMKMSSDDSVRASIRAGCARIIANPYTGLSWSVARRLHGLRLTYGSRK